MKIPWDNLVIHCFSFKLSTQSPHYEELNERRHTLWSGTNTENTLRPQQGVFSAIHTFTLHHNVSECVCSYFTKGETPSWGHRLIDIWQKHLCKSSALDLRQRNSVWVLPSDSFSPLCSLKRSFIEEELQIICCFSSTLWSFSTFRDYTHVLLGLLAGLSCAIRIYTTRIKRLQ